MRHRHAVLVSLWISAATFAVEAVAEDAPITIEYGPTDDPAPVTLSTGRSADGLTLNLSIHLNLPGASNPSVVERSSESAPPAVRSTEAQGWGPGDDGDRGGVSSTDGDDDAGSRGRARGLYVDADYDPAAVGRPRPYDPPAEAPRSRRTRRARAEAARYDAERDPASSGWARRSPTPSDQPTDAGDEVPAEASDLGSTYLRDPYTGWATRGWSRPVPQPWYFALEAGVNTSSLFEAQLSLRSRRFPRIAIGFGLTRSEWGGDAYKIDDAVVPGMMYRFGPGRDVASRTRQGYYLAIERYKAPRGGAFAGLRFGGSELVVDRLVEPFAQASYWVASVTPVLGYHWFPGEYDALFVRPYLGASLNYALKAPPTIEGTSLRRFFVSPLVGITAGLAF